MARLGEGARSVSMPRNRRPWRTVHNYAIGRGLAQFAVTAPRVACVSAGVRCEGDTGDSAHVCSAHVSVPPNQRWVVEYASIMCLLDPIGTLAFAHLSVRDVGQVSVTRYRNTADLVGKQTGGYGYLLVGHLVRLYVALGSQVSFNAAEFGGSGNDAIYCDLSLTMRWSIPSASGVRASLANDLIVLIDHGTIQQFRIV
jgi:hypothetical protein